MKYAYLQFGKVPGPFQTVKVECFEKPLWWQLQNLTYTATGYGAKIPTRYMVKYDKRIYRVYCAIFGNVGTCWVKIKGEKVIVSEGF